MGWCLVPVKVWRPGCGEVQFREHFFGLESTDPHLSACKKVGFLGDTSTVENTIHRVAVRLGRCRLCEKAVIRATTSPAPADDGQTTEAP